MSGPAVLVVAAFDDVHHAHAAQRCRALERLGCRVEAFDLLKRPGFLGRLAGGDLRGRLRRAVEAAGARFVLSVGALELEAELVERLRSETGIPWINWFPDDLRTADDVALAAAAYNRVFVAGSDVATRVAALLGREAEVLPLAADPSVYRPVRSKDQYRANVVFVGAATPRRATLLAGLAEFGLALWGPGWRETSLRDYCRGEVPNTHEYVRAYGGASVAINIHHTAGDGSREAALNQRVFELASIGVPQVVDDRADLKGRFEIGKELLTFRTAEELRTAVESLLHDPQLAETVGAAARRAVLAGHTYMHRLHRVLDAAGGR